MIFFLIQDKSVPELEIARTAESIVEKSKELNHIKSTLLVIENSTKEISDNLIQTSEEIEQCQKRISIKLERLNNAVTNLNVPDYMATEVERKTSLLKSLKYLKSCHENNIHSKKTRCKNCKWVVCKCNSVMDNLLNFTQPSEILPNITHASRTLDNKSEQKVNMTSETFPSLSNGKLVSVNKHTKLFGGGRPKVVKAPKL